MKYLLALCLLASASCFAHEACVTYNPSNGTYTVDPSGSVDF